MGALLVVAGASALLSVANWDAEGTLAPLARAATWFWLMLAPGVALSRVLSAGDPVRGVMTAVLLSPVVLSLVAVVGLLAGLSPRSLAVVMTIVSVAAVGVGTLRPSRQAATTSLRELVPLFGVLLLVGLLTAYLPLTREWWRVRSDAWFHAAVVAQMRDYGLPPGDPYFLGMPLQYMWFYHAMVLTLCESMKLNAFWVMALANVQAVIGLGLAAYALAGVFRARVAHRLTATISLLFAFNAAFWILLPIKASRLLIGDVRGGEELARTYALTPFTYNTVCGFMNIYYNQEFFLDKFMVATAFGFALAFMTAGWYAATDYLASRRPSSLCVLALALVGMLGFHSLVGFVMLVGLFGGSALVAIFRNTVVSFRLRDYAMLLATALACFVVTTPYLYQVMHVKEQAQVIPIDFSFPKTAGIFVSSAFVLAVALRRRILFSDRSPAARMFLFGTVIVTAFCLSIKLPGPNTFDKLGYFVFIPLAILAGFGIADSILSRKGRDRLVAAAVWTILFLVPVNGLAIAGCFWTPDEVVVTDSEARVSAWVRANTDRSAVFIDDNDQVFLLVTGPRRYYWGRWAYAQQWGYPRLEMARRYHVREGVYGRRPMDASVLESLAGISEPLFLIVRREHGASGARFADSPFFHLVYDDRSIALYRVDPAACRAALSTAPPPPSPEEIVRESGL